MSFTKTNEDNSVDSRSVQNKNLDYRIAGDMKLSKFTRGTSLFSRSSVFCFLSIFSGAGFAQQTLVIDVSVFGLNKNQNASVNQINDACNSVTGDMSTQAATLIETCDLINSLDPNDAEDAQTLAQITEAIAPEEAFAVNDSLAVLTDYQTTNVRARLDALRTPALDTSTNLSARSGQHLLVENASLTATHPTGGGASSDLSSPLGTFVSGHVSSGEIDGDVLQQNADTSSSSFTVGADYRLTDNVSIGLGLGALQHESSFNRVAGGAEAEGFNATLFASWYETGAWYLDFVLDLGQADYELERSVSLDPAVSLQAVASTSASTAAFTLGGGRTFQVAGFELGGYLRLSHRVGTIDAYSESLETPQAGFAALFSIEEQEVVSTEAIIGVELSKAVTTTQMVLVPLLRLEFISESETSKDDVEATLITTGTVASYSGQDRVGSYGNFGLGGIAVFARGRSAYAYYESHIGHDLISQDWIKAGLRLEF